jgi:hypothetical protein
MIAQRPAEQTTFTLLNGLEMCIPIFWYVRKPRANPRRSPRTARSEKSAQTLFLYWFPQNAVLSREGQIFPPTSKSSRRSSGRKSGARRKQCRKLTFGLVPSPVPIAIANPSYEAWPWARVKRQTDKDDALKLDKSGQLAPK